MTQSAVQGILDFWFGAPGSDDYGKDRMAWFMKNDEFDEQCRTALLPHYERAVAGDYNHWVHDAYSALALLVLLDQVPRNLFRGSARSFSTDAKAREVARHIVAMGLDQLVLPVMRVFMYLPFEHSETMSDQLLSVALFEKLGRQMTLVYAWRHREIVDRFGRFPHRNAVMGRISTPEEEDFLQQPNSGF